MSKANSEVIEEERRLIKRYKRGDGAAGEALLGFHDGMIRRIARHYGRSREFPFEDAYQASRLGFLLGIKKFDLKRGVRLVTYATWWARHETRREMQSCIGDMRVPVGQQERGMPPIRARRLDAPVGQVDGSWSEDTLADITPAYQPDPEEAANDNRRQAAMKKACAAALRKLDRREREVALARLAVHEKDRLTLEEIGKRWGTSRERVRQIEVRAKRKLRVTMMRFGGRELLAA